jgi:hypothetical protein
MTIAVVRAQIFRLTEARRVSVAGEDTMPKRVISYAPVVAAGLCTVIAFGTNWALAAGDCLVQPNRQPTQVGHWYYRVDRVNYRKCWYLAELRTRMSRAEAPEAGPSPDATLQQRFSSLFSSLSTDFKGAKPAGTQQDVTNSDARIQIHPKDDVPRTQRALIARHSDLNTAFTSKLYRQSPTGRHAERRDQPPPPLDQAERDALFQEFLRWKADERPAPPLDQAERDALFQEFLRWKARQTP